jgi:hypothetical protein
MYGQDTKDRRYSRKVLDRPEVAKWTKKSGTELPVVSPLVYQAFSLGGLTSHVQVTVVLLEERH